MQSFGASHQTSQFYRRWHYRDRIPRQSAENYCQLLFFHFVRADSVDLIDPANWAGLFSMPELAGVRDNPGDWQNVPHRPSELGRHGLR